MIYFADRTVMADLMDNTVSVFKQNVLEEKLNFPIERDEMFQRQLNYFLANLQNPDMMNSIPQAAGLFRKIVAFRENKHEA